MATIWERAAQSVYLCSLCILTCCINFSYFPLKMVLRAGTSVLIASVPAHCLSFTIDE